MRTLALFALLLASACGDDDAAAPFATTMVVTSAAGSVTVDLSTLDQTTFEGAAAIRLTRVVEAAVLAQPTNEQYNLVGATDALAGLGARAGLPFYGELGHGFLVHDGADLVVRWDATLGFPAALSVAGMAGGTLAALDIAAGDVVLDVGGTRASVNVTTLATVAVTDYKHPEDGAVPMATLVSLFAAAGVAAPEGYVYRITGKDGFANGDDNLMPWTNATHGYIEPTNRKLVLEEAYDTSACCWRVYDTVLIEGVAP